MDEAWWEKEWCPLFGSLPSDIEMNERTERYAYIITEARKIWGAFEYAPGVESPEPVKIATEYGFPVRWIEGIRFLVHVCSAHEILFDAQFRDGLYKRGSGWKGEGEDAYLASAADQIDDRRLIGNIKNRAGMPTAISLACIDWQDLRYWTNKSSKKPLIYPAMLFAVMAISVSWQLIRESQEKREGTTTASQLLTAERLLARAYAERALRQQRLDDWKQEIHREKSRKGGKLSREKSKPEVDELHSEWQRQANALWKQHPLWSKKRVAEKMAKTNGDNWNTIRRNIEKQ
jgi:hypothetical protein